MAWNVLAAPAIASLALGLAAAAVVLRSRPDAAPNRRLSLLLVIEGVVIFGLHGGAYLVESERVVWVLMGLGTVAVSLKPAAYLSFLATLPTTWTRWFRSRAGQIVIWSACASAASLWFIAPTLFIAHVDPDVSFAAYQAVPGPMLRPLAAILGISYLLGLSFAISAISQAPTPSARQRARYYTAAFCTRELLFVVWAGLFVLVPYAHRAWPYVWVSIAFMPLAYIPLVAYGILKTQLFDIDLRVKWTVRRGTVVAALGGALFLVKESLEALVPAETLLANLAGAAAIALLLLPTWRLAGRVADAVMPGVDQTPGYLEKRKLEVYRATLESIGEDGTLTERERRMLSRLRRELKLDDTLARRIEGEVLTFAGIGAQPVLQASTGMHHRP